VTNVAGEPLVRFAEYSDEVWFETEYHVAGAGPSYSAGMALYDDEERLVYQSFHRDTAPRTEALPDGLVKLRVRVPVEFFHPGQYRIRPLLLGHNETLIGRTETDPDVVFELQGKISASPHWIQRRPGSLAPRLDWQLIHTGDRVVRLDKHRG
jgi:hypothetical protein